MFSAALILALIAALPASVRAQDRSSETELLRSSAVTHEHFIHRTLYSWTTKQQALQLKAGGALLVAHANSGGGVTPFNSALRRLSRRQSPEAEVARALLEHPDLFRRRYAWPSAFATAIPLGLRSYGNDLIRIDVAPTAWVGHLRSGRETSLRVVDPQGREIPLPTVSADPMHIAVVFHEGIGGRGPPFREYVICNERLVTWAIETAEIRSRIDQEIHLLETLAQNVVGSNERRPAILDWHHLPQNADVWTLYRANLAFDTSRHRPSPENLEAIVRALRRYP